MQFKRKKNLLRVLHLGIHMAKKWIAEEGSKSFLETVRFLEKSKQNKTLLLIMNSDKIVKVKTSGKM